MGDNTTNAGLFMFVADARRISPRECSTSPDGPEPRPPADPAAGANFKLGRAQCTRQHRDQDLADARSALETSSTLRTADDPQPMQYRRSVSVAKQLGEVRRGSEKGCGLSRNSPLCGLQGWQPGVHQDGRRDGERMADGKAYLAMSRIDRPPDRRQHRCSLARITAGAVYELSLAQPDRHRRLSPSAAPGCPMNMAAVPELVGKDLAAQRVAIEPARTESQPSNLGFSKLLPVRRRTAASTCVSSCGPTTSTAAAFHASSASAGAKSTGQAVFDQQLPTSAAISSTPAAGARSRGGPAESERQAGDRCASFTNVTGNAVGYITSMPALG